MRTRARQLLTIDYPPAAPLAKTQPNRTIHCSHNTREHFVISTTEVCLYYTLLGIVAIVTRQFTATAEKGGKHSLSLL